MTYAATPVADAATLMYAGLDELDPDRFSMIDWELESLTERIMSDPVAVSTMLHVVALTASSAFRNLAEVIQGRDAHSEVDRVCTIVDDLLREMAHRKLADGNDLHDRDQD